MKKNIAKNGAKHVHVFQKDVHVFEKRVDVFFRASATGGWRLKKLIPPAVNLFIFTIFVPDLTGKHERHAMKGLDFL